jgi:hypothetical protein
MNPLLTDILTAAYGPLYVGTIPPGSSNDENDGYRPGSVGYDTVTERFYVCQSALSGNAVWILIPADANYQYKLYSNATEFIALDQNTSVFKADNTDDVINTFCYVLLPANPYTGKVIILYFQDAINDFFIKDSSGAVITAGGQIDIPAGQQYTITYNGVVWEIVGVSNINPALASGVAVTKGATTVPNITAVNFIGSSVTVASGGGGVANVTITPLAGVDVSDPTTTVLAAQEINFGSNFDVAIDGAGASVTLLPKIQIKQDSTDVTDPADNVTSLNFIGPMFHTPITIQSGGTRADITLNGAKVLLLSGDLIPNNTHDRTAGYSIGSLARNTGNLQRTYICRVNGTSSAVWDLITEDTLTVTYSPIASGTTVNQLSYSAANVVLNSQFTTAEFILGAPRYAYLGKKVYIFSYVTISALRFKSADGSQYYGQALPAGTGIVMVCTSVGDGVNQVWQRIG